MGKKSGSKASLRATLVSQQSRLKKKQKSAQAAQAAEQKAKKSAQVHGKANKKSRRDAAATPTVPFRALDRILLIGEGNFSFARALVQGVTGLPPQNVTATAYDSEGECIAKYPEAAVIVADLRERGVEVLFEVDATRLERVGALKGRRWDRVVWNFPHAGKGITDQDRNIRANQELVVGFLRSASRVLVQGPPPSFHTLRKRKRKSEDDDDDDDDDEEEVPTNVTEDGDLLPTNDAVRTRGTILITLRNVIPYTLWDIPRLAKKPPANASGKPNPSFMLLRSFAFDRSAWKGYEHRMTKGERAHGTGKTGEGGEDRTWEFCLRDVVDVE